MKEESPSSRSLEASQIPAMKMAEQENGVLGLKRDCFWRRSALRGVVTMVTVRPQGGDGFESLEEQEGCEVVVGGHHDHLFGKPCLWA